MINGRSLYCITIIAMVFIEIKYIWLGLNSTDSILGLIHGNTEFVGSDDYINDFMLYLKDILKYVVQINMFCFGKNYVMKYDIR